MIAGLINRMHTTSEDRIMKVFISVDMEGVACVTHGDHVKLEGPAYEEARKWMTGEAKAAILGAKEAGASEIVVADGHGHMHNLIPEALPEDISLIQGVPRTLLMMGGIDGSYDAAMFIGYHARAGDAYGTLAHSFSGRLVSEVRLNGEAVSEAVFNAAVAGHFGVPLVLVSGDDQLGEEIAARLPWAERVITKRALSATAARTLTPQAAQTAIQEAARRALERLKSMRPLELETPVEFEVEFRSPMSAMLAADIPGVERREARRLFYAAHDMLEASRIWRLMLNVCMGEAQV